MNWEKIFTNDATDKGLIPKYTNSSYNLNLQTAHTNWRSVFILILKKGNAEECSNYCTIVLLSHNCKVMLKILKARLQQYVNSELPDVPARFGKGRGTRDQIANIHWIIRKTREFHRRIYFCFIDYTKVFDCVDHKTNCEKFLKRWEFQAPFPVSWEMSMCVKKQQLEPDMKQQINSKLGKECINAV